MQLTGVRHYDECPEEVDVSAVDWRETLRRECPEELTNVKTINYDFEEEDDTNETS